MRKGWIQIHLAGAPRDIGFQHGSLLAREIEDTHRAVVLGLTHDSHPYAFFREAAEKVFLPATPAEYLDEMQGIAEGIKSAGGTLDLIDIAVLNASLELPYYVNWLDDTQQQQRMRSAKRLPIAERCSAFMATGSYTRDGRIVAGHNCWSDYLSGARWNVLFDIRPRSGHRFFMDGLPGLIHSGDDFGVTAAGLIITETTISNFHGFDKTGTPEFVRARQAMQYATSIPDFVKIMREGNNGGYANNWLVADHKSGEIASLELGLRHVNLSQTKDGYFVGANFPVDPKLAAEETDFDASDLSAGPNARRTRWTQLMNEYRGRIDVGFGQRFLADHYDAYGKRNQASERTLCGHIEDSPRGVKGWAPPHGAAGSVQNKVTDSAMAARLSFTAAFGHACGTGFHATNHLKKHPEFEWQRPSLRDLPAQPWTVFEAGAGA